MEKMKDVFSLEIEFGIAKGIINEMAKGKYEGESEGSFFKKKFRQVYQKIKLWMN